MEGLSQAGRRDNSRGLELGLLADLHDRLKVVEQKLLHAERARDWLQRACTHFTGMLTSEGVICATCSKRLTYGED